MNATDRLLSQIMEGSKQFIIPIYQRDYSCKESQCKQLWNDILKVARDPNRKNHFFGSVAYIPTENNFAGFQSWFVVDGQQRLTTITLLFCALRDHLRDKPSEAVPINHQAIQEKYLFNKFENCRKLRLRKRDDQQLEEIVEMSQGDGNSDTLIYNAYRYFLISLDSQTDLKIVYEGIMSLKVVEITLSHEDNPQLIFESLNATGVNLEQSDLVRNFMLLGLPLEKQEKFYKLYWSKIEEIFKGGGPRAISYFLRAYIGLKVNRAKSKLSDLYSVFKDEYSEITGGRDVDEVLAEMLELAQYHAKLSQAKKSKEPEKQALYNLNKVLPESDLLVMALFRYRDKSKTLTQMEFLHALKLLESYSFRRMVCRIVKGGYWKSLSSIAFRLDPDHPFRSLKVKLSQLGESARFPSNEFFKNKLIDENMYSFYGIKHLLDALTNFDTKEPEDTSPYTVEHVLPQNENLRQEWREMLGENWTEIQSVYLHKLGNLTLTGYNSEYSDRPLSEKQATRGGFKDSAIRLNRFIAEQEQWTEKEIEERSEDLANKAILRWPSLDVSKKMKDDEIIFILQRNSQKSDLSVVAMDNVTRKLFEQIQSKVMYWAREGSHQAKIFEISDNSKQISYHIGHEFFAEMLFFKHCLRIYLPLQKDQIENIFNSLKFLSELNPKFVINSWHWKRCDAVIYLSTVAEIEPALKLIGQSFNVALEKLNN